MSHTAEKLLAMRFFWCIALVRAQKFLLSSFLGGVNHDHTHRPGTGGQGTGMALGEHNANYAVSSL